MNQPIPTTIPVQQHELHALPLSNVSTLLVVRVNRDRGRCLVDHKAGLVDRAARTPQEALVIESTGNPIPNKRLESTPVATTEVQ